MVFGWFLAKRTTVLLRGQCHAHLFFCKKPARLQLSLCARSSKLSSQQHQCSYSLCTASNSTLAPVVAGTGSRSLQNYCSGSLHHQNQPRFSRPLGLLYVLLLPMVLLCTRKGSSFYATSILVYIHYYTLWKSRLYSNQHWAALARAAQGSRAAAYGQTSQLLQHDQIGERNGCPFVQIQSRSQQVNSFFLYCTSFPTNISELLGFL